MVTSPKIKETEMGYRGSKSSLLKINSKLVNNGVKEQRVDGSWCSMRSRLRSSRHLRCTLMGFERSYQVKILTKHLKRYFTTLTPVNFNP